MTERRDMPVRTLGRICMIQGLRNSPLIRVLPGDATFLFPFYAVGGNGSSNR